MTLQLLKTFNSGNNSELINSIVLQSQGGPAWYVLYSIDLNSTGAPIKVGDFIIAETEFTLETSESTYNTACEVQLILATSSTGISGTEVSEENGTNDTPSIHELKLSANGTAYVQPGETSKHYLNALVNADSAHGILPIAVNADRGRLSCEVFGEPAGVALTLNFEEI